MKAVIKQSLKQLLADRYLLFLLFGLIILSIISSIIIGLSIHPSELQLVSHYTAFGITHLYRDQWFYLYVFIAFELIVAVIHSVLAVKLLVVRGRSLAITLAWVGVGMVILGLITAESVINVWTPL